MVSVCSHLHTFYNIHIIYYNARSLLLKLDELVATVEAEKPDIILCIVETWTVILQTVRQ